MKPERKTGITVKVLDKVAREGLIKKMAIFVTT